MAYKFNPTTGNLDLVNDIDETTLHDSDIGVTVHPYDPDYVQTEENYTTVEKDKLANIEEGATADLTAVEIKSLYESNADTNAYTDVDQSKLAGIEAGAEVNVQSDWDAVAGPAVILNQPVLGTASTADLEEFQPADPTILKEADIGTTVQGYSANTVVDSEYAAVKSAAQSALQSDDLDGYAPLNNPAFTGVSLILPNNTRINGIEHFYQSTKPEVRGDDSALVIGDRWWKTDEGVECFWNGSYWVSVEVKRPGVQYRFNSSQVRDSLVSIGATTYLGGGSWLVGPTCYLYKSPSGGLFDANNYHRLTSVAVRLLTPDYQGDYGIIAYSSGVNNSNTPQGAIVGPPMPAPTTSWQFYKETRTPTAYTTVSYFAPLSANPIVIAGTPGDIVVVNYIELRKIYDD